jgi:hypothetical protein
MMGRIDSFEAAPPHIAVLAFVIVLRPSRGAGAETAKGGDGKHGEALVSAHDHILPPYLD